MKHPRTIVVKTLLSPDEFIAFDAGCSAADISHSKVLRDLARDWLSQRQGKDRRHAAAREWPGAGQNMAMSLPGRVNYSARPPMNLRV